MFSLVSQFWVRICARSFLRHGVGLPPLCEYLYPCGINIDKYRLLRKQVPYPVRRTILGIVQQRLMVKITNLKSVEILDNLSMEIEDA